MKKIMQKSTYKRKKFKPNRFEKIQFGIMIVKVDSVLVCKVRYYAILSK